MASSLVLDFEVDGVANAVTITLTVPDGDFRSARTAFVDDHDPITMLSGLLAQARVKALTEVPAPEVVQALLQRIVEKYGGRRHVRARWSADKPSAWGVRAVVPSEQAA